jgi:NADH-quinone oxidoreductase subunit A
MPDTYFTRYLPLLIQLCLAGGLGCVMVLLSWFIGQHKYNKAKMSPYECGMTPIGDARQRFSVKFYLVAMLFILFDVEAVFLYPWAIIFKDLKMFGFWEMLAQNANLIFGSMMSFLGILFVGYIYALKKRAFDWKN